MNKTMYMILFWISMAPVTAMAQTRPASATRPFEFDEQSFTRWTTYYYRNPQPGLIPAAIRFMTRKGLLTNPATRFPMVGLLSELFKQNPESLETWSSQWKELKPEQQKLIWSALWYANTPAARKVLNQQNRLHPGAGIGRILTQPPPDIYNLPVTAPEQLDYLWAVFLITGDAAPVIKIIENLKLADQKHDLAKIMIYGAARWSLTANCRQHPKVLTICRQQIAGQPETIAAQLRAMVQQAEQAMPKTQPATRKSTQPR